MILHNLLNKCIQLGTLGKGEEIHETDERIQDRSRSLHVHLVLGQFPGAASNNQS